MCICSPAWALYGIRDWCGHEKKDMDRNRALKIGNKTDGSIAGDFYHNKMKRGKKGNC